MGVGYSRHALYRCEPQILVLRVWASKIVEGVVDGSRERFRGEAVVWYELHGRLCRRLLPPGKELERSGTERGKVRLIEEGIWPWAGFVGHEICE